MLSSSSAAGAAAGGSGSSDVFAGPSLNFSRLQTFFSLLADYPKENTWQAPSKEGAAAAPGPAPSGGRTAEL